MTLLEVLLYYWRVLLRAAAGTANYVSDQKLVSLTILFLIGLVVYWIARARFPRLLKEWGNPMDRVVEFVIFSLISVAIYAAALFTITLLATPSRLYYEQLATIQELQPPDDLDLYYRAQFGGAGAGALQYHNTTVTNRSKRNMNLSFYAHLHFTTDAGEFHRVRMEGEWNGSDKPGDGAIWINVQAENTFVGSLQFFLPSPESHGLQKWDIDSSNDVIIKAVDTITGTEVFFKAMDGYPDGRVTSLPKVDKDMAMLSFKVRVVDPPIHNLNQ